MCNGKLKQSDADFIYKTCQEFNFDEGELVAVLHKVQKKFGFLPPEVQISVSEAMQIPISKVYGVVSFYTFFTMTPKGKYPISVCTGTACYVRGIEPVLREIEQELSIKSGEVTPDGLFSLNCLRCVGACGLAPVMMVADKIYGHLTPEEVGSIIDSYRKANDTF